MTVGNPVCLLCPSAYIRSMPHAHSSGDATADRRFAYAMDYKGLGDLAAAADLLEQALECAPGWAAGWLVLGDVLESLERNDDAVAAYRRSLTLDAMDRAGAGARLARLGRMAVDGAMTPAHIAALFDDYAGRFETSLVQGLAYRGPALLHGALRGLREPFAFGHTLDLGCGTGLAGEAFGSVCASIDGVDLSEAMLARARQKKVYRRLVHDGALEFLRKQARQSTDLVLAADVFVYLGDLQALFSEAARVLAPGGLLAFSAQRCEGPDAFILGQDMRYAHSLEGIETWAQAAGLTMRYRDEEWARMDRGRPVPGMVVVLAH